MGKEDLIERILSDAKSEAEALESEGRANAEEVRARARADAETLRAETEAEISERAKRISEGRAAAARLDGAKILLAEKRRVLDVIYSRALNNLLSLKEHDALALYEKLLEQCAEKGETIVFAERFPYAEKVATLPVVKARGLSVSETRAPIKGGFLLKGDACDKDVSFETLLELDREEHQAEIAAEIFR